MAGTYTKPKAYNRRFFINIGTSEVPEWAEISQGITSRGNSFTENEEKSRPRKTFQGPFPETGLSGTRHRMKSLLTGFTIWRTVRLNLLNAMIM